MRSLKEVVKLAHVWGIKVLDTVFDELSSLAREKVRVHCMGELTLLPDSLRDVVASLGTGLKFCIALSYSGRSDITSVCQRFAARVQAGELSPSDVTEAAIEEELKTSWVGEARDPDLLIRTSGEQRLSNFVLWQAAYSAFHFVDSLWPDSGVVQFKEALLAYQNRSRRFGKRK